MDPVWSPQGGISGLTVIVPDTGGTLKLTGSSYNSEAKPGIIMLLESPDGTTSNFDFQAARTTPATMGFCTRIGQVKKGSGGFNVHGMIVAAGDTEFEGTVNVYYNDNCIVNLGNQWASNVKILENTWRELQPE